MGPKFTDDYVNGRDTRICTINMHTLMEDESLLRGD